MREFEHTGNPKVLRSRENKHGWGRLIPFLFAFLGLTLSGCDRGEVERPSWMLSECPQCEDQEWTSCLDGIDNDQDQLTDCTDPDCGSAPHCGNAQNGVEATDSACSDGIDNDDNGYVDCNDYGCLLNDAVTVCRPPEAETEGSLLSCADGLDNDWDGDIDCKDPDCGSFSAVCESTDEACTDGLDNDNNGYLDCQDFNCSKNTAVTVCTSTE
jgi:hypothetical protein